MKGQKGGLRDRYISKRLSLAKIKKNQDDLDFLEFYKLLDFDNRNITIYPTFDHKTTIREETFSICYENVLEGAKSVKKETKENSTNYIDFSIFDELLNDCKSDSVPMLENKKLKKFSKQEILIYLENEIKFYEEKLENNYKLDNLEDYEYRLFDIKNKITHLKNEVDYDFMDYKFHSTKIDEITRLLNVCKEELKYLCKNDDWNSISEKIDSKIKFNTNLQQQFLNEIRLEINSTYDKVLNKIYFCMLKRMLFNLYRLIVGLYKLESSKNNYLRLNVGTFLIINAVVGMKKAIKFDFSLDGYYYFKDYNNNLNQKEVLIITYELINKSIIGIDEIKSLLKNNFAMYKNYIHDYEELYFKIDKIKELLENKTIEIDDIIQNISSKKKLVV